MNLFNLWALRDRGHSRHGAVSANSCQQAAIITTSPLDPIEGSSQLVGLESQSEGHQGPQIAG